MMSISGVNFLLRKSLMTEGTIVPPDIPNTINFWHGGNLDAVEDYVSHKKGRFEYGAGLYLTQDYNSAIKYAKGSRKLYLVTVNIGTDVNDIVIPKSDAVQFVKQFVVKNKVKEVMNSYEKTWNRLGDDGLKGNVFNCIILNYDAIKPNDTPKLKRFLTDHGADYEIFSSTFGTGRRMMVLYNNKMIANIIRIKSGDKLEVFDLD